MVDVAVKGLVHAEHELGHAHFLEEENNLKSG
jgi:hypothetical protein